MVTPTRPRLRAVPGNCRTSERRDVRRGLSVCLVLGLTLGASIVVQCAFLEMAAWAGSRSWSNRDWSREAERAREQAQQAAERARELAQQAAERARQQAQQAAERAARQQARQSRDDDDDNDRQVVATPTAPRRDQDTGQNKRNDKDKDNDKDDGGDRSGSQRNRDKRDANRNNQDSNAPPATVVEFFKRLAAPTQPKTQEPVPALVPTQTITTGAVPIQKAKQNAAPPPPAKKPPPKLRVGPLGPPPVLANNTIVGVRLNSAALKRVTELGFKVAPASPLFQPRTTGVTQLVAPERLRTTAAALDLLRQELPGDRFGLNYAYRPYEVATGDKPEAPGVRQASFGGCTAQRCYGPAVIGWQPNMRSCARDIRIGVIDTSVDRNHPAFKGRNLHFRNFLPNGARSAPNWHGTGVMAVLAGNADSGTPGLVPDASFFAADVYHSDEQSQPVADTASLLKALDWMSASKVQIVNMSMSGPRDELIEKAIKDLSARGILFVAAAGNGGPNAPPSFPAAYDQVIAVTAVGKDLRGYVHANHGDYIDVAAPGVGIWTALPDVLEGYQSGTSFAAPHVTAILAAVHGQVQARGKAEILDTLAFRDLGPAGTDRIYGRGLVLAPPACSPEQHPGGWVTNVVRAPVMPLESIPSGLTARPSGYK